jgi:molybdenum cofactor biosynthesis enzyme
MPCPRCGSAEVSFHDPRRYLPVSVALGAVAVVLYAFGVTGVATGAVLAAGLSLLTVLGMEKKYSCGYCRHTWRFRDAEKWAKAIRHDREAGAGGFS